MKLRSTPRTRDLLSNIILDTYFLTAYSLLNITPDSPNNALPMTSPWKQFRTLAFSIVIAVAALGPDSAQAAVSYLMVQGQFPAGGAVQTYRWKVEYTDPDATGQDLLDAIFGVAGATDGNSFAMAGDVSTGVKYKVYSFGNFVDQFFVQGNAGSPTPPYVYNVSSSWNYFNAGGSYDGDAYDPTLWAYANSGTVDRMLDGAGPAYDAWVFGLNPTLTGSPSSYFTGNYQLVSNSGGFIVSFASAVPEPGRAVLLVLGFAFVSLRRRRTA